MGSVPGLRETEVKNMDVTSVKKMLLQGICSLQFVRKERHGLEKDW